MPLPEGGYALEPEILDPPGRIGLTSILPAPGSAPSIARARSGTVPAAHACGPQDLGSYSKISPLMVQPTHTKFSEQILD